MLEKNTLITVTNRDNGSVGYVVPDLGNLHRNFQAGESKEITMDELRKLSYLPGGRAIIKECLVIQNQDALKELLNDVEPEYFYTKEDVKNLLLSGSENQLLDCLDFAPMGVIDLVKELAVELKINDIQKRRDILEKTGFNVTKAIEINEETESAEKTNEKVRRSAPIASKETESTPVRRTTPKYKVTATY